MYRIVMGTPSQGTGNENRQGEDGDRVGDLSAVSTAALLLREVHAQRSADTGADGQGQQEA